jgi:hypothetical protein
MNRKIKFNQFLITAATFVLGVSVGVYIAAAFIAPAIVEAGK